MPTDFVFKRGDIIVWKGNGPIFSVLAPLLRRFLAPWWDKWGWHTGVVVDDDVEGNVLVAEALGKGVSLSLLTDCGPEYRVYRVLQSVPQRVTTYTFFINHQQYCYDRLAYIYTALQRTICPWFPHWDNQRYTCWELAELFCLLRGFNWANKQGQYALLTDFLQVAGDPVYSTEQC